MPGTFFKLSQPYFPNYEKHALQASQVIAVLVKTVCKHPFFLATRAKKYLTREKIPCEVPKIPYLSTWLAQSCLARYFSLNISVILLHLAIAHFSLTLPHRAPTLPPLVRPHLPVLRYSTAQQLLPALLLLQRFSLVW